VINLFITSPILSLRGSKGLQVKFIALLT